MDIVGSKVLVIFLMAGLKLGFGLLPLLLTKYFTRKKKMQCMDKFIGVVLCLGGGILLSTVFIHMIKEVRESLEAAVQKGVFQDKDLEYPFAELLICMGFLLIFLVESVVHKFFGGGHTPNLDTQTEVTVPAVFAAGSENQSFEEDVPRSNDVKLRAAPLASDHPDTVAVNKGTPAAFRVKSEGRNVYNVTSASVTSANGFDAESTVGETQPTALRGNYSGSSNSLVREKSFVATIRGFLIVLALSIHSLFEGMAIGLEEDDAGVWKLFTAVIIHAIAIVFCIGTEMISSGLKKKTIIIYMVVLGFNSPVGVLIGLIVTLQVETAGGGHLLAVGVLQGLAGGTLLYITFFEVLSREKLTKYKMTGLVGILAIMVGFTIMAVMEGFGSHSHSHGGRGGPVQAGGHGHANAGRTGPVEEHAGHDHIHSSPDLFRGQRNFRSNPLDINPYDQGLDHRDARVQKTNKDNFHDNAHHSYDHDRHVDHDHHYDHSEHDHQNDHDPHSSHDHHDDHDPHSEHDHHDDHLHDQEQVVRNCNHTQGDDQHVSRIANNSTHNHLEEVTATSETTIPIRDHEHEHEHEHTHELDHENDHNETQTRRLDARSQIKATNKDVRELMDPSPALSAHSNQTADPARLTDNSSSVPTGGPFFKVS